MKMKPTSLLALLGMYVCTSCSPVQTTEPTDYTRYVNTFIGAADNGHTFPGACRPFGMIQASPETNAIGWQYCSGYNFKDSLIWGFSQTHLNGTGCMDLGDLLVMPVTGRRVRDDYKSPFRKETESAMPGYYTVELDKYGVKAELTATDHVALHRYTYNTADSASLLLDLQHGLVWNPNQYKSHVKACETKWEDARTLTGHVRSSVWVNQDLYFVMKFNKPVVDTLSLPMEETEKGKRLLMSFDVKPEEELLMKVAISTTGVDGAKKNMEKELSGWDFDAVRKDAKATWNNYLGRIEVTGTPDELENFYTSFYHALIQPNNIADVDGKYRNAKDSVVQSTSGAFYSTFSLWDTYRAAHPFYTLAIPERVDGFVNSMVEQCETQGYLPVWALWGKETNTMIGNHAVSVIAEAYKKGFRGFDAERAFNAIKQTLTVSHPKSDWETYMKYGYYPTDKVDAESVSRTLESVYDDYAASSMAEQLGKKEDAAYFKQRSEFYKNLFDTTTQFMRPKHADGQWKSPFNPSDIAHAESRGGDYTEGNAWQYTWHVQHDVPGLIKLFGGEQAFLNKLDSLFTMELTGEGLADVTGLIGQYAHGNEPSHHVTFLYTLAGRPERTQELIREIFDTQYKNKPDGLCGNDDCGQMSAWYMFNAMGFYPVDPVSGNYVFGAPQLPKVVLHLPDNKTFTVIAENLSKESKYIESIMLNGEPYEKNYISHEDIVKGGTLVYRMK